MSISCKTPLPGPPQGNARGGEPVFMFYSSASCHLILETFVACWDGHSDLARECAKVDIIPCNAPSRLRVRRWYSLVPLTRSREDAKRMGDLYIEDDNKH
ncbi:protein of unknown function [Methanoculleus bourgensis]|uniref:Uncharacterized protein n=1 Tax=Methanoculleus bourgensis TaxID=83986 RepID=A0A0X3BLM9_9EURY|nr:protein of unknown function [Methanoculleus bourgensis]